MLFIANSTGIKELIGLKEKFRIKVLTCAHQELPCNPIIGQPYEQESTTPVGGSFILESEGRKKNLTSQKIMKRKFFAKGDGL